MKRNRLTALTFLYGLAFLYALAHGAAMAADFQGAAMAPDFQDAGNPESGKRVFAKCRGCHNLGTAGNAGTAAAGKSGPDLDNLFGRLAGGNPVYSRYSAALRGAGFVWDAARLDQWLADPRAFLPGNKMAFAGLPDAIERRDLIAYLKKMAAPHK